MRTVILSPNPCSFGRLGHAAIHVAILCAFWLGSSVALSQGDTITSRADYQNQLYDTNDVSFANQAQSITFFSGNIGATTNELVTSTNIVRPNDGGIYLVQSMIGQPVGMFTVPFNLYVQGTGTNTTVPQPELWYQLDQSVSLQATPGRYYAFARWSDGNTNNPRPVVAGMSNGFTAIFTNTVQLVTNSGYVTQFGKPLILLNGQIYPDDVVVTNAGAQLQVTMLATYPGGSVRYTLNGAEPSSGTLYSGAFNVTAPFHIRAMSYDYIGQNPLHADPVNSFSISTPGGGSVSAQPQTDFFNESASVIINAVASNGWSFLNWAGDSVAATSTTTIAMDTNRTVQGVFGTTVHPVAMGAGVGSVTNLPALGLYPFGSTVRLAGIPAPGSKFVQWGGIGIAGNTNSPIEYVVTNGAPVIQATFSPNGVGEYSLTAIGFSAVGSPGGEVVRSPAANSYASGANVTLIASNYPGQSFVRWTGDAGGNSTNIAVTMTNTKVIYAEFAVTQAEFQFASASYSVNQAGGNVVVTVQNIGVLSNSVTLTTSNGTATGGNGVTTGEYGTTTTNLFFASGPSSQSVAIPIRNQFLIAPSRSFQVSLSGAPLAAISNATVTIHYSGGLTTNGSQLLQAYPRPLPLLTGAMVVSNNPAASAGQWKFRWEDFWREEGDIVTNLEAGSYDLEFREMAGYVPYPFTTAKSVASSGVTPHEAVYYPTAPPAGLGSLQLLFRNLPPQPAGAAWRLRGELAWRPPNSTAINLLPGVYEVQFATVHGHKAPNGFLITIGTSPVIVGDQYYDGTILPPTNAPSPLANFSEINVGPTGTPRMPYVFNGQLSSPINSKGSGVAVASNVVLTAAHVVFDYTTLAFVGPVYWAFQKHEGDFTPRPLTARGWNVMSGYAAARVVDKANGLGAAQSSPQSRQYDVAALYFTEQVARGGFGGYLSSDLPVNEWLTGSAQKMIVGYPVDAAADGYTNVVAGKMHATQVKTNAFVQQNDRVYGTTDFLTFGGNSGGPVYVQYTNSLFYPVAVYLGRVSGASVMRAIDSNVVDLIVRSMALGDLGTNNTGGGVITLVGSTVTAGNPAYVQVILGPPAAIQAGAGWRLVGDSVYGSATNYTRVVTSTNASIEFKPIPGWNAPTISSYQVQGGLITPIPGANYTVAPPQMSFVPGLGFGITGTTNTKYRIEYRTDLASGVWLPLQTNTLNTGGFNLLMPWPPTNNLPAAFYRAVWLP